MANKTINLKSSNRKTLPFYQNEVYVDISLSAKQFIPEKLESGEFLYTEETKTQNSLPVYMEHSNEQVILNDYDTGKIKVQNRIAKSVNVKAVFNSIQNMFSFTQGERILFPEFGNKLRQYLYKGITNNNVEQITAEINRVCTTWEPRMKIIKIQNISSLEDTNDNIVRLNIVFEIIGVDDVQYEYSFTCNTVS